LQAPLTRSPRTGTGTGTGHAAAPGHRSQLTVTPHERPKSDKKLEIVYPVLNYVRTVVIHGVVRKLKSSAAHFVFEFVLG
jgi:hypothetical protein